MSEKRVVPPAYLEKGAKHVEHDVRKLRLAFESLQSDSLPADQASLAYIAWYVLFRAVCAFLDGADWKGKKFPNDIRALDYFDDPGAWSDAQADLDRPSEYDDVRAWTNVLAAHLSYSRIGYEENYDAVPSQALTKYALDRYDRFLGALPAKRREWFQRLGQG